MLLILCERVLLVHILEDTRCDYGLIHDSYLNNKLARTLPSLRAHMVCPKILTESSRF